MSKPVIRVENLGKKYLLKHQQTQRYIALRDVIANSVKSFGRNLLKPPAQKLDPTREEFWALKDVSFEVNQGDRIGIIGRNGAGKSTLLKILSRITEPTTGQISLRGRVASLLEVGTGFHPELTGRENIYLNGAILGMTRTEIKRQFDEIVAFAEVEKFLDTPVKHYSSGMYVRLAFAVAAHLEPEILVVDEVLAVGDAEFQKKCLGRMKEVGNEGRTVIFVSHNMSAIQLLCDRCIVLNQGNLLACGDVNSSVQLYSSHASEASSFSRAKKTTGKPTIIMAKLRTPERASELFIQIDTQIICDSKKHVSLDVRLADRVGNSVGFGSLGTLNPSELVELQSGFNDVSFIMPIDQLATGGYTISLDLTEPDKEFFDRVENCLSFEVIRPPSKNHIRVLSQSWGHGCFEIELKALR